MLTHTTRTHLLKLLKVAHLTYQCPLIWDIQKNSFVLDTTTRYKVLSRLIFFVDCLTLLNVVILLVVNYIAELKYSFTLLLLFFLISVVVNIVLDINNLRTARESLQFLNTIWRMAQSPQGNYTQASKNTFKINR